MSIRGTISFITNKSGTLHLYKEALTNRICIEVDVSPEVDTHYKDMELTIKDLDMLIHDIKSYKKTLKIHDELYGVWNEKV